MDASITIGDVLTAINGCVEILEDVRTTDARIWTVTTSPRWASEALEMIDDSPDADDPDVMHEGDD